MSWAGLNPVRRPGWLMAALVVGYGLGYLLLGERLPRGDGFGWDGNTYRFMTEHPGEPVDWISRTTAAVPAVVRGPSSDRRVSPPAPWAGHPADLRSSTWHSSWRRSRRCSCCRKWDRADREVVMFLGSSRTTPT